VKLQPLEEGHALAVRFGQHASIEFEPGKLSIRDPGLRLFSAAAGSPEPATKGLPIEREPGHQRGRLG
jgi:hypothetical protein